MIITCEKCYAKFNLDENLLKQTGSKVRCSKCQNIFLTYPPTEMERVAKPAEEVVGSETVSSDVEAESVEQVEVPEEEAKAALETEEEEFDLTDLNLEEAMEPEPEAEKELDLSDTEEMLDIEEKPEPEAEVEEEPVELELELDTEPVVEETPEEAEAALETDEDKIELSSLNIKEEPEAEVKEKPEEPELESELEGVDEEETKKEVEETVDLAPQADQLEAEGVEKPKKRISAPVLIVLIIALLTGGTYATYVALKSMNIKIPFIRPAVQDEAGNLKIIAFDITDKFMDNSKSGKLLIISGKVKNEYSGARSFISVTGRLYAKEKVLLKTTTVYCGNVLSDQDLSSMDMNSINKRLSNLFGDNKSNVNVNPGKLLRFLIVFPNIPDNTEEYTIEVAGSSTA